MEVKHKSLRRHIDLDDKLVGGVAPSKASLADEIASSLEEAWQDMRGVDMTKTAEDFEHVYNPLPKRLPEEKLMVAILRETAVNIRLQNSADELNSALDYVRGRGLFSDSDDYLFSFSFICRQLGLDEEKMVAGFLALKDSHRKFKPQTVQVNRD